MRKIGTALCGFLTVILLSTCVFAGNTWERIGPVTYISVVSQSPTTIIILAHGQILVSSDLGRTWKSRVIDDTLHFSGIAFADSLHGVIAESKRYVLRTSDGGVTWQYHDLGEFCFPRTIAYPSKDSLFLVDAFGRMWRSTDAGNSWTKQQLGARMQLLQLGLGDGRSAGSIFFHDSKNGFAVGDSGFKVLTTDGGEHWRTFQLDDTNTFRPLNSIYFYDTQYGIIASINYVFVTSDGGKTWLSRPIPDSLNQSITYALMDSPSRILLFGPSGSIYESNDFGMTIRKVTIPESGFIGNYFLSAVWLPTQGIAAVGEKGTIANCPAGGGWQSITSCWTTEDGTLAVVQSNTILLVSSNWRNANYASRSTSDGKIWKSYTIPGANYAGIHFSEPEKGILFHASNLSQSMKTVDGGITWQTAGIDEPPPYTRRWTSGQIHFSKEGTGYAGNENGILRSTDHGLTWRYSDFDPPGTISSPFPNFAVRNWYLSGKFFSLDANNAYALVTVVDTQNGNPFVTRYRSMLVRTADAGESWTLTVNSPRSVWITSLYFVNADLGFLGCADGILFRTSDGGSTWDSLKLATNAVITAIAFNGLFGVIGTRDVELFITTDGGISWLKDGPTLRDDGLGPFYITQIIFPDSNSVIAIGKRVFFKRDIHQVLSVNERRPVQGNQYMYISIFPNPAHSEFTCTLHGTYSDPSGILSAVILDVLGRTVLDLTKEAVYADNRQTSQFTVDVSRLSPGVYFLRYTLGRYSYYRRFVKH